jgi:hypothetical protein
MPPGKLAHYGNAGEEYDLVPARSPTISAGDYVHGSDEEEAVLAQTKAISEAEARARFRREEADAVRQVREYEVARREARVCRRRVKIFDDSVGAVCRRQAAPPPAPPRTIGHYRPRFA